MNTRKIEQPALITQCNLALATEAKTNAIQPVCERRQAKKPPVTFW